MCDGKRCAQRALLLFWLYGLSASTFAYNFKQLEGNYIQGNHAAVVAEFLANQSEMKPNLLVYRIILCESLYALRDYAQLQHCTDDYVQRIVGKYDKNMHAMAFGLKALAYFDVGDYASAVKYAEETLALQSRKLWTVQYEQWGMSHYRPFLNAYFVKAMVEIRNNPSDTQPVDDVLASIELMDKKSKSILTNQKHYKKERNITLAKIYLAQGRFQDTYDVIRTYDEKRKYRWLDPIEALASRITKTGDYGLESEAVLLPRLYMFAKSAMETSRHDEAMTTYETMLASESLPSMKQLHYLVLHDVSKLLIQMDQTDKAVENLKTAIDVIELQRSSINTESSRIGFVGDKSQVYGDLVDLLYKRGEFADALHFVERGKARALVDILATKQQFVTAGKESGVASLLSELNEIEINERLVAVNQASTRSWDTRRSKILKTIKYQNAELASLVTVDIPALKEIQKRLAIDESLIEYFADDRSMIVFVLDRESVTATRIDDRGIDELIRDYRWALQNPRSTDHLALGGILYARLLAPVRDLLIHPSLTVVPHGSLHYLPFGALNKDGRYLVQDFQIRMLPSASVLQFLRPLSLDGDAKVRAMGNPDLGDTAYNLPFAEKEALAIGRLFPGSQVLVREQATESVVKQLPADIEVLHIASHGTFNTEQPLNSGLALKGDAENDGFLTVSELYDIQLNVSLVTLSACETALGEIGNGDDVIGLTRGFLFAGASSIVASLWKVDDQGTSDLMQQFYTGLFELGPASALQQAQIDMSDRHPFYWAAFQLTGGAGW